MKMTHWRKQFLHQQDKHAFGGFRHVGPCATHPGFKPGSSFVKRHLHSVSYTHLQPTSQPIDINVYSKHLSV